MTVKEFIQKDRERFDAVVMRDQNPQIRIADAAEALGVPAERLRNAITSGNCPFGYTAQASATSKRYACIQRATLIAWYYNVRGFDFEEGMAAR